MLVVGETEFQRELVAERVHEQSRRRGGQFLRLAAPLDHAPRIIASSGLYRLRRRVHRCSHDEQVCSRRVDGGTLFFDEVGEIPAPLQAAARTPGRSRVLVGGLAADDRRPVRLTTNPGLKIACVSESRFRGGCLLPSVRWSSFPAAAARETDRAMRRFIRATCIDRELRPALRYDARALNLM